VGVESDADAAGKLLSELEGKDVQEVIASGLEKLASVPAGGAVAAAPAAGGAAAAAAPAEEEKKQEEEEEDADMGFSLFD
jgi:large subunit ribosomal protein LP2